MTSAHAPATRTPRAHGARWATADLTAALRAAGTRLGDTVFVHLDLKALGRAPGEGEAHHAAVLASIREAVGADGTILVPTYTFSFCRREEFDPAATPTAGGPWSPSADFLEFFRGQPGTVRSSDPIHSVAGQGPAARALLLDSAPTCFGDGSVFARLAASDALICMVGLALDEATLRHHTEESVGVPFRYLKLFTGWIREGGVPRKTGWAYNVRILADNGYPDGRRLSARALDSGIAVRVPLGEGAIVAARCGAFHAAAAELLREDPWATARGPAVDPVAVEAVRAGSRVKPVVLAGRAGMHEMIEALWRLPRDIVSEGYDAALAALATQVPMAVHEYPSGMEAWSWIIPEKWTCAEAWLETVDGRRLLSYADNPLHVVSYSLPFEGIVPREELLRHLHVHPRLPHAVPFMFKYYEKDWGLCCSRELRDSLRDPAYRVVIRTSFSLGTLKVGEVVVPGESDETFVLCAHLCHPAMVNDDLSGVVVGVDAMRTLLEGPRPRYTYRLLIVPETIGSIAYLSRNGSLVPRMRGGLFLEMLGRDIPHALQLSFAGDTHVDRRCTEVLAERDPRGWTAPFRALAGNDERQFNAPGMRVPMLSLTRQLPPDHPEFPYREYHSSEDTPDRVPDGSLEASRDLLLAMLRRLDTDDVPVNAVPGEICCSRYGIHVDFAEDPAGHKALFDVLFLIDGTRSVGDIAAACGVAESTVRGIVQQLRSRGLVRSRAGAP
jgi:aminopeptidase-like protein/aminoglycoside N3'-acetyltransferase